MKKKLQMEKAKRVGVQKTSGEDTFYWREEAKGHDVTYGFCRSLFIVLSLV